MPLVLNDEQKMLKETAKALFQEKAPVSALRKLRDEKNGDGFCRTLWQDMVKMGFAGMIIPEEHGGLDFGYTGLGCLLEESGRTLTASPLISTVLLGATAINIGGSADQKAALLPAIASGEMLLTLALEEGVHHAPAQTALTAVADGDQFILTGKKKAVIDGHVADNIIIAARTAGKAPEKKGISLFLVDAKRGGVSRKRTIMVDSRNFAEISFENAAVPSSALLGELHQGYSLLEKVLNIGRSGLAAEMLGIMLEAFERAVAYLKDREQFGVPIGSFQALQHRAADMFCEIELCKSVVLKALQAIDDDAPELPLFASLAKAKTGEVLQRVTNEAVQMFGGIGMTDDEEIGFFLKRARVAQQLLGDTNFHLGRFAGLNGY